MECAWGPQVLCSLPSCTCPEVAGERERERAAWEAPPLFSLDLETAPGAECVPPSQNGAFPRTQPAVSMQFLPPPCPLVPPSRAWSTQAAECSSGILKSLNGFYYCGLEEAVFEQGERVAGKWQIPRRLPRAAAGETVAQAVSCSALSPLATFKCAQPKSILSLLSPAAACADQTSGSTQVSSRARAEHLPRLNP